MRWGFREPALGCTCPGLPSSDPTIVAMPLILAAKVWHYWMAVPLVGGGLLLTIALGVGYLVKVSSHKPPRQ